MAISNPTLLDTQTLQKASALNSASISPSANALLIIVHCVLASSGSGWTDAVSDSFGANLGDWSSVGVEIDGAATVHMWIHYAQCSGTPGSGTVTVDPSGGTQQIMFVLELTGHNTTSPVAQSKTYSSDATPTSPTITLDDSPASGSLVLGAIGGGIGTTSSGATSGSGFTELADTRVSSDASPNSLEITLDSSPASGSLVLGAIGGGVGTTSSAATSGSGFTELADPQAGPPGPPTGVTSCAVQYDNGGADTTCDWSLSNYGQTIVGIALEIAAASGASPVSITLDKAAVTASGKALSITKGAVSITLAKAALVASGKSLMVTPGAVSVTLDKAGLTAAGKSLTVMPGAVSVTLDKAALIAAGKKVTVTATAAITVTLGKATITASGKSLTVTPGAVSISLDKAAILTAGKSIAVSAPAPDTGGHSAWAYNRWKEMELREYLESEDEIVILLASAEVIRRGRG